MNAQNETFVFERDLNTEWPQDLQECEELLAEIGSEIERIDAQIDGYREGYYKSGDRAWAYSARFARAEINKDRRLLNIHTTAVREEAKRIKMIERAEIQSCRNGRQLKALREWAFERLGEGARDEVNRVCQTAAEADQ